MHICTFLCHSLSTLPGRLLKFWVGQAGNHGRSQETHMRPMWQRRRGPTLVAASGPARDWLPFSRPEGQLVSTAGVCWSLPSLRIPMGMDSLGSAHLAALKAQEPMDSVCTAPGSIITATTCLHLTPAVQSHFAQPPRITESLGKRNPLGAGSCAP